MWEPQIRKKAAGKRHFFATQLFNVARQFFVCCNAAFGKKGRPHCRKANVAVQLLQRNFRNIAAQLLFSLVVCCRGGVQRGGD